MSQDRVLEVFENDDAEVAQTSQCPLSHRVARRVGKVIIAVLCIAIAVVFCVLRNSN